jgi:hypothetical protein
MTRYIQRLAKSVGQETYRINIRIILLHVAKNSPLLEGGSLMGIYFKVKRGSNRMNGKNRYALYPPEEGSESANVLVDEAFEQRSVFYQHEKQYQEKKVVIKLK